MYRKPYWKYSGKLHKKPQNQTPLLALNNLDFSSLIHKPSRLMDEGTSNPEIL